MKPQETLDYHFRKLWHGIARAYNTEASKHGLSMSVGFTLLSIDKKGTPSTQLGPLMGMESRSLTRMLKNLENLGWIEKKASLTDKRVVLIHLTDEGKRKRQIAREAVIRFNTATQREIDNKDMEAFFRVCSKLSELIEQNNIFSDEQKN